jgi:hypothetical protein
MWINRYSNAAVKAIFLHAGKVLLHRKVATSPATAIHPTLGIILVNEALNDGCLFRIRIDPARRTVYRCHIYAVQSGIAMTEYEQTTGKSGAGSFQMDVSEFLCAFSQSTVASWELVLVYKENMFEL